MQTINALNWNFPSPEDYARALRTILPKLNDGQVRCLRAHYQAPDSTATARQLAESAGYANYRGVNLQYGHLAVRLCEALQVTVDGDAVCVLASFARDPDHEDGECQLVMRPQLVAALESLRWHTDTEEGFAELQRPTAHEPTVELCRSAISERKAMGQAHILCVREDALTLSELSADLPAQVGEAVVRLCVKPERHWTDSGLQPTTWAAIGACSNGIEHADEVHSTDRRLYIWVGNCLRPIHKIEKEELKLAEELLQEELRRRGG